MEKYLKLSLFFILICMSVSTLVDPKIQILQGNQVDVISNSINIPQQVFKLVDMIVKNSKIYFLSSEVAFHTYLNIKNLDSFLHLTIVDASKDELHILNKFFLKLSQIVKGIYGIFKFYNAKIIDSEEFSILVSYGILK